MNSNRILKAMGVAAFVLAACNSGTSAPPTARLPEATAASVVTPTLVPTFTETPVPSLTLTVRHTPAPSVTPSPRPTKTETPQPKWVAEFSQPILDAIASRLPNVQDDFDDKSGGWQREGWCGAWRMKYQEGELILTSCGAHRANNDYSDFVAKLDGRFLPDTKGDAWWSLFFRDGGGPSYLFGVNLDGSISVGGFGQEDLSFPSAAISGYKTNHLLLIAKGPRFAFYANGKPLLYMENSTNRWGDIWFRAWDGGSANITDNPTIVAFDNFRLWDISDISLP